MFVIYFFNLTLIFFFSSTSLFFFFSLLTFLLLLLLIYEKCFIFFKLFKRIIIYILWKKTSKSKKVKKKKKETNHQHNERQDIDWLVTAAIPALCPRRTDRRVHPGCVVRRRPLPCAVTLPGPQIRAVSVGDGPQEHQLARVQLHQGVDRLGDRRAHRGQL